MRFYPFCNFGAFDFLEFNRVHQNFVFEGRRIWNVLLLRFRVFSIELALLSIVVANLLFNLLAQPNARPFRLWLQTRALHTVLLLYCSRLKKMVKTGPLECMELNRYCTVLIRHYLNEHTELYRIFQKLISSWRLCTFLFVSGTPRSQNLKEKI